jgi:hypothetical protein
MFTTGRFYYAYVNEEATVFELKLTLFNMSGIPTNVMRLIHAGLQIQDGLKLYHYNIADGGMVHLIMRHGIIIAIY